MRDGRGDAFSGARALVVGGAGFVGGRVVRRLLDGGAAAVEIVDNFLSAERSLVPGDGRIRLIEGSIADPAVLARLDGTYDAVFHLATFHGNQNSIVRPLEDHDHNTLTTLRLYERLTELPAPGRVVYAASGCTLAEKVFGEASATVESDLIPVRTDSPYQISKVIGEFYSVYYSDHRGLPTVRARFQNVYGPGEVLGAGVWRGTVATVWRNVVPSFVYRALEGLPLRLDNEGAASRDFIHVDDIARGLLDCAERGAAGDVYNLASGVETTIRELAETILELTGSSSELQLAPRRSWDHAGNRYGSPAKARAELGFEAAVGLRDGLIETIAWTREHLDLIRACVERHRAEAERAERAAILV